MPLSWNTPLSLYSIPVVWSVGFLPHVVKMLVVLKNVGWDNVHPRANTKRLADDEKVPREVVERVERLEGTHQNSNETLPLWVGGVLAANLAGVANKTLNLASAGFIFTRLLYNCVYVNQCSCTLSWTRSALYFTSIGFPMYLLIKAGNLLRKAH